MDIQKPPAEQRKPDPYEFPCPHCGEKLIGLYVEDPLGSFDDIHKREDMTDTIRQSHALWGDTRTQGY